MKIELNGYNIDNLLKTLYAKKVTLFNVVRNEYNSISFEILDKDYKKVKRHIANFKVKTNLSKFKQLPKFILANLGVILGVFFGVIFMIFASNYTWQINVYGTKELTANEILKVLKDNGIKKGKINLKTSEEIENILLNNYDRIAQVSVIREGTAIIINLSEKLVYNEQEFKPITAKYNGIITDINIITGTTNVKVGDYVNIGDVLVLPFNINADGSKVSVCPLAEIKGEIFYVTQSQMNKTEQVLVPTGKEKRVYKYKLKNLDLFSGKNKNSFALFDSYVYNENISNLLPFNRDVVVYKELSLVDVEHDFNAEKDVLIQNCKDKAYQNLPTGNILTEETKSCIVGDTMYAITTIKILGIIND